VNSLFSNAEENQMKQGHIYGMTFLKAIRMFVKNSIRIKIE